MTSYPARNTRHVPHVNELSSKLPSDRARTLLRRLRDLNLFAGPVAITREIAVSVAGCLSVDRPAETGICYRLRDSIGRESTLEIGWTGAELALALDPHARGCRRELRIDMRCDTSGYAFASAIGARVQPENATARELEHFLRRVVRAVAR